MFKEGLTARRRRLTALYCQFESFHAGSSCTTFTVGIKQSKKKKMEPKHSYDDNVNSQVDWE